MNKEVNHVKDLTKWYDSKLLVLISMVVFFPVGFYGLVRSRGFKSKTKYILAAAFSLILVGMYTEDGRQDQLAVAAGYADAAEYRKAQKLGFNTRDELLAYQERQRASKKRLAAEEKAENARNAAAIQAQKDLEEKNKDRSNDATGICRQHVKANLISPASADFPWSPSKKYIEGNQAYIIKSHVDAQNAFGAMIRSNWHCKIQYEGGKEFNASSWKLIELEII